MVNSDYKPTKQTTQNPIVGFIKNSVTKSTTSSRNSTSKKEDTTIHIQPIAKAKIIGYVPTGNQKLHPLKGVPIKPNAEEPKKLISSTVVTTKSTPELPPKKILIKSPPDKLSVTQASAEKLHVSTEKPFILTEKLKVSAEKAFEEEMLAHVYGESSPEPVSYIETEEVKKTEEKEVPINESKQETATVIKANEIALVLIFDEYLKKDAENLKLCIKKTQKVSIFLRNEGTVDEKNLPKEDFLAFSLKKNPLKNPPFLKQSLINCERCKGNFVVVALEQEGKTQATYEKLIDNSGYIKNGQSVKKIIVQNLEKTVGQGLPEKVINEVAAEILKTYNEFSSS